MFFRILALIVEETTGTEVTLHVLCVKVGIHKNSAVHSLPTAGVDTTFLCVHNFQLS